MKWTLSKKGFTGPIADIDSHLGGAEDLHQEWSSFDDGSTLRDIEQAFVDINAIYADAEAVAKLIENGRRSYGEA